MPPLTWTPEATCESAAARGVKRLSIWLPMLLLLGINVGADIGGSSISLRLVYLLPLLAAWWARQDGVAVVLPIALLSIVPEFGWKAGFFWFNFAYSDVACLLAAGAAIAAAPGDAAARFVGVVKSRQGVWLAALVLMVTAAVEGARHNIVGSPVGFAIDPLALLAVPLALLAVSGRQLAAAVGRSSHRGAMLLVTVMLLALAVQVSLNQGGSAVRLGSASASALVPAAVFAAVMCGWTSWWRALLLVGLIALLEQLAQSTVGSFAGSALGLRSRPMPWIIFAEAAVATMMGTVFAGERAVGATARGPAPRQLLALSLALAGVFAVLPALSSGSVQVWGAGLWTLAGVSFLGGRHLGGRGAIGVPMALLLSTAALAVCIDPQLNKHALSSGLPTLAGAMLTYGLAGWLAGRRAGAGESAVQSAGDRSAIDISAVTRVVHQLDQAATLRAFFALLVPVLVLWHLAGVGVVLDFGLEVFDGDENATLLGLGLVAALAALWPLGFVVVDWMDRQDRFRVVSGVSAGALAWLGAGLAALALGALLPLVLDDAPGWARALVVSLLISGVLALALWLPGLGKAWLRAAQAIGLGLAVTAAVALVTLFHASGGFEEDATALAQLAGGMFAVVLVVIWGVRSVRLRLLLAEDRPRSLLYGAIPQGGFWVRMAALLGLPSSMWSGAAFGRVAAWCFMLARPLVYAGAALVKFTPPLGVLVIAAGHALFVWGKRQAAALPWHPDADKADQRAPVLFLRSFADDQFDFQRPGWQLRERWYDLWSFRRNIDETMVDEVAAYGPVVALGQPGEAQTRFGAMRHYASHEDWQDVVVTTARRAHAIVLVAGESPGLRWEFDMLRREGLLDRTVLLLHPDPARADSNRRSLAWLLGDEAHADRLLASGSGTAVALWQSIEGPRLLRVDSPTAAAYLVALRAHFQRVPPQSLDSVLACRQA